MDSRTVYDNVKRALAFVARDRGYTWEGNPSDVDIYQVLFSLSRPEQNLGCLVITAVLALRSCQWPLNVVEALAIVPLNGQYADELVDAFQKVEDHICGL